MARGGHGEPPLRNLHFTILLTITDSIQYQYTATVLTIQASVLLAESSPISCYCELLNMGIDRELMWWISLRILNMLYLSEFIKLIIN